MRAVVGIIQLLAVILGVLFAALLIAYVYYTHDIRYPFEKPTEFVAYDQMPNAVAAFKADTKRTVERRKVYESKNYSLTLRLISLILGGTTSEENEYNWQVGRFLTTKYTKSRSADLFAEGGTLYCYWVKFNLTENEKVEYLLNHEYFGKGCEGIACAARVDFGKNAHDLTPDESAILVKILPRNILLIEKHYGKKLNELTEPEKADLARILTSEDPFSRLPPQK